MDLRYVGKEHEIVCPSGRIVTIRENNGDDEAILTKMGGKGIAPVAKYLSGIIVKDSEKIPEGMTPAQHIRKAKRSDAYYIMYKGRLINLGSNMGFAHKCSCDVSTNMEVETDEFDRDFSMTEEQWNQYCLDNKFKPNETAAIPYPKGSDSLITYPLSSGKDVRFNILSLEDEDKVLAVPKEERDMATQFKIRKLQVMMDGLWTDCTVLSMFSSKDMKELRGLLRKFDPQFDPIVNVKCPDCSMPDLYQLLMMGDFFYPVEI